MNKCESTFGMTARRAGLALLMAASLSACTSQSGTTEDRVGSFMVAPGKYTFFTCAHLAMQTGGLKAREKELEDLIAKAGTGPGGSVVSALAYRPEYIQVRGNLIEVRKAEAEKNCHPPQAAAKPAAAPAPRKR